MHEKTVGCQAADEKGIKRNGVARGFGMDGVRSRRERRGTREKTREEKERRRKERDESESMRKARVDERSKREKRRRSKTGGAQSRVLLEAEPSTDASAASDAFLAAASAWKEGEGKSENHEMGRQSVNIRSGRGFRREDGFVLSSRLDWERTEHKKPRGKEREREPGATGRESEWRERKGEDGWKPGKRPRERETSGR